MFWSIVNRLFTLPDVPSPQAPQTLQRSRIQVRTLNDLQASRAILKDSANEAVRILAGHLERIHDGLLTGEMGEDAHRQECHRLLEAAQMLNGDDDMDEQAFAALNLAGRRPETHALTSQEYTMLADDLALQLHEERGIAAFLRRQHEHREQARREMNDAPLRFGERRNIEADDMEGACFYSMILLYAFFVAGEQTVEQIINELDLFHRADRE